MRTLRDRLRREKRKPRQDIKKVPWDVNSTVEQHIPNQEPDKEEKDKRVLMDGRLKPYRSKKESQKERKKIMKRKFPD